MMSPTVPSCWAWTTWRCRRCPWQWDNARWRRTSAQCGGHDLQPAWRDRGSSRARQTPRGWQRWRSNPGEDTHKHTRYISVSEYPVQPPQKWNNPVRLNEIEFVEILFNSRILSANWYVSASSTHFFWLECITFLLVTQNNWGQWVYY